MQANLVMTKERSNLGLSRILHGCGSKRRSKSLPQTDSSAEAVSRTIGSSMIIIVPSWLHPIFTISRRLKPCVVLRVEEGSPASMRKHLRAARRQIEGDRRSNGTARESIEHTSAECQCVLACHCDAHQPWRESEQIEVGRMPRAGSERHSPYAQENMTFASANIHDDGQRERTNRQQSACMRAGAHGRCKSNQRQPGGREQRAPMRAGKYNVHEHGRLRRRTDVLLLGYVDSNFNTNSVPFLNITNIDEILPRERPSDKIYPQNVSNPRKFS